MRLCKQKSVVIAINEKIPLKNVAVKKFVFTMYKQILANAYEQKPKTIA